MLPGGSLADLLGRKVAFLTGMAGFAGGAIVAGALLRPGPLDQQGTPAQAPDGVPTAQAEAGPARPASSRSS